MSLIVMGMLVISVPLFSRMIVALRTLMECLSIRFGVLAEVDPEPFCLLFLHLFQLLLLVC